jgi:hypothetical protein
MVTIKQVQKTPEVLKHRRDFMKRWNIQEEQIEDFSLLKNRIITIFEEFLNNTDLVHDIESGLFFDIGKRYSRDVLSIMAFTPFADSQLESFLLSFNGLQYEYLRYIEIIIKIYASRVDKNLSKKMAEKIAEAIELSKIQAILCLRDTEYIFYPKYAELLDERLVNDNLNLLEGYPRAREKFHNALCGVLKQQNTRDIIDNLRLSLELFLKDFHGNDKSLENQVSITGKFLESKSIAVEIRNMYGKLFDLYTKYNNNNVKHDDKCADTEVEFCIYLTGSFIRFLIKLKN